jgi:hypothetical protein
LIPPTPEWLSAGLSRQGDDRHPHLYAVLRGDVFEFKTVETNFTIYPGEGPLFERCIACHGAANDPVTGIPGTTNRHFNPGQPFWFMPPKSIAWESAPGVPFTGPELCAQIKDNTRNGNRELTDVLSHLNTKPLALWPFNHDTRPDGQPRTTPPPLSHAGFVKAFGQWIDEGAPCPSS